MSDDLVKRLKDKANDRTYKSKPFNLMLDAAERIEAQGKLIEEMREVLETLLNEAPSTLSCGMRCQLEIEHMEEEAYMAAYANAEFVLSKAKSQQEGEVK